MTLLSKIKCLFGKHKWALTGFNTYIPYENYRCTNCSKEKVVRLPSDYFGPRDIDGF